MVVRLGTKGTYTLKMCHRLVRRLGGKVEAVETAVGLLPVIDQLNLDGVDLSDDDVQELFRVDAESWRAEAELTEQYFEQFGDRVPSEMWNKLSELRARLG